MSQEGVPIRPGYNNIITLSSSKVDADESMRELNIEDRYCLFPEENEGLKIHKQYSYLNCKFECNLFYAQAEVLKIHNTSCLPWFFPTSNDDSVQMCSPWESYEFFQIFTNKIPDNLCPQCLPDCSVTLYEPSVITQPFYLCDAGNLGVSEFCTFNTKKFLPMQNKLLFQILNEYYDPKTNSFINEPTYLKNLPQIIRYKGLNVFNKTEASYNPFDQDIAMVQIIYQKSTVVQVSI